MGALIGQINSRQDAAKIEGLKAVMQGGLRGFIGRPPAPAALADGDDQLTIGDSSRAQRGEADDGTIEADRPRTVGARGLDMRLRFVAAEQDVIEQVLSHAGLGEDGVQSIAVARLDGAEGRSHASSLKPAAKPTTLSS